MVEQYREAHKAPHFCRGTAIKGYVEEIKEIIEKTKARTLLDYGCGKGHQYSIARIHEYWGVMPALYDPGVPGIDRKPQGKFDGVICTDVLEHVEDPEETLEEIFGYAEKFVFLTISVQPSPAHKRLPNGGPLHIAVHPKKWWLERIRGRAIVHFDVGEAPRKPFFTLGK